MGAVSRVCSRSDGSVPDVLFNIRPNPNTFKLCSKLKQCNAHMVLNMHIIEMGELKLLSNELSGGATHMA